MNRFLQINRKKELDPKAKISHRLLALTILFSTVFSLFVTFSEMFIEYKDEMNKIDRQLASINSNYVSSLKHSLWYMVTDLLDSHLDVIKKLPEISYVGIITPGDFPDFERGRLLENNFRELNLPLVKELKGQSNATVDLGKLVVQVDLTMVYSKIAKKAVFILVYQVIKNLLLCLVIIYFFNKIVVTHIQSIIKFISSATVSQTTINRANGGEVNVQLSSGSLMLNRKYQNDELQFLVDAINDNYTQTCNHLNLIASNERLLKEEVENKEGLTKALQDSVRSLRQAEQISAAQLQALSEVLRATGQSMTSFDRKGRLSYSNINNLESKVIRKVMMGPMLELKEVEALFGDHKLSTSVLVANTGEPDLRNLIYSIEVDDQANGAWVLCAFNMEGGGVCLLSTSISEMRSLERKLNQAEKMDAIGTLASGIAHDVNNVLGIISLNLEMLKVKNIKHVNGTEVNLQSAIAATDRGADLMKSLLSFSRRETNIAQTVDVVAAVQKLLPTIKGTLGPNIDFRFRFQCNPNARVCKSMLEMAIINLVVNASDAIDGNGIITVDIRNYRNGELNKAMMIKDDECDYFVIEVIDNGAGVPGELVDNIFEPFFTTKASGKGTGLGLTRIFSFAKESGGYLNYMNNPKGGAIFQIILPKTYSPKGGCDLAEPMVKHKQSLQGKILIIDDEVDFLNNLKYYLRLKGMQVQSSSTIRNGIKILQNEIAKDISIIVVDLNLADGYGFDIIEPARHYNENLPIILMTGNRFNASDSELEKFDHIIHKPFKFEDLHAVIQNYVESSRKSGSDLPRKHFEQLI